MKTALKVSVMSTKKHPLALGAHLGSSITPVQAATPEERIVILEKRLESLVSAFTVTRHYFMDLKSNKKKKLANIKVNKQGIPIGASFFGTSKGNDYMITVAADGSYVVGVSTFNSLSSAAEAVSGVRRSGWVFWKTFDGRTLKEAFNK